MTKETRVSVEDGKYTFIHTDGMNLRCLRNDLPWRDLVGDKAVLSLVGEVEQLRERLASIHSWIVCAGIATPEDMMENAEAIEATADNQDVPLEEYPDRILKVLDSIVGPRLDAFKHEVFNYPYALEKAEKYDRLQPYLCKTCGGYGAVGNILTAEPCPECALPASVADTRDAERYRWLRNPRQDVSLVLDKVTGYTPIDKFGAGGYNHYEYRSGEDLDSAIDAAIAAQAAAQGEN